MACRFPGEASTVEGFWEMLTKGETGHSKVPEERYDAEAWHHPYHERRGAIQPRSGFFLKESAAAFDAPFFSITAKEAAGMDPMQRKLLEVAYEAFENAGMPMESVAGTQTGVYAGSMTDDYSHISTGDEFDLAQNSASGISRAMLANRVSWFFDLRGPSLTLDTACSSSLYALHLACQSLRLGETEQALVCGANMVLSPNYVAQLSAMHMVGPDGISHSFDARANGYARGEAIGAVVVKTLRRALADGDTVRAVVRGTGANQDGKTAGITVPSQAAQEALIRQTYRQAGLPLADTAYFEAHGTGTQVGDPIELAALHATFALHLDPLHPLDLDPLHPPHPLVVGSVKTNVGHTEGAAGIAAVIKAVLALERAQIPPLAGFDSLNPKLHHLLADGSLVLPRHTLPWPSPAARRASVNSFGFGGANAHAILDDAAHYLAAHSLPPSHVTVGDDTAAADSGVLLADEHKLFVFSTHDSAGAQRLAARYAQFLRREPALTVDDLAYTLSSRRSRFNFRSHFVAPSLAALATLLEGPLPAPVRPARHDNVIFVFTGQGAQWPAMGRELLRHDVFGGSIARSQAILDALGADWRVEDFLDDPTNTRLDEPRFCQPVCSILQFALVDLLRHWGVFPKATVGHSSGELASAYAANLVRFDDAVRIAYFRGVYCDAAKDRLESRRGTMLATALSESEALEYIQLAPKDTVWIGCINSPSSVTLSGDVESIDQLEAVLKGHGKFARKLRVQLAYHSPHMQVVAHDFRNAIGNITPCPPSDVIMFSSVTGERVDEPASVDADFWTTNMLSSVKFDAAVGKLLRHQLDGRREQSNQWSAAVEVGPHEALKGPFNQIAAAWDQKAAGAITYTGMLSRGKHGVQTAKAAAGVLWSLGHPVDLAIVNDEDKLAGLKVLPTLPPYAWNHDKDHWHEPSAARAARLRTKPRTELLGMPVPNQNPMEPVWRNFLRVSECPWQKEHVITGTILYPGAGMLIMAVEAALQLASTDKPLSGINFHDVYFDKGLVIPAGDQGVETFLSIKPHESLDDWYHYTVFSLRPDGSWIKHSWGKFAIKYSDINKAAAPNADWAVHKEAFDEIAAHATKVDPLAFYDQLQSIGIEYGPSFRNVISAGALPGKHQGVATVVIPDTKSTMPHAYEYAHLIHPATLDAIFHLVYVAMGGGAPINEASIPQKIGELFISTDQPCGPDGEYSGYSEVVSTDARGALGSIFVSDKAWLEPKIIVRNMVMTKVSSGSPGAQAALLSTPARRVAQLNWKEDIDYLVGESAEKLMAARAQEYQTPEISDAAAELGVWLDLACHKHADLKVLLLQGPDVWQDSIDLLARLAPRNGHRGRFRSCSVFCASEESVKHLKDTLADSQVEIECQVVDLTALSPEQVQDFGPYDLILGPTNISPDLNKDLLHLLKLMLMPGGQLALVCDSDQQLVDADWKTMVTAAGFDLLVAATGHPKSKLIIASISTETDPEIVVSEIVLLERPSPSEAATSFANQLNVQMTALGFHVSSATLSSVGNLDDKAVISLLEVEEPFIISWNADEFELFRKLVSSARYILWITRGGPLTAEECSLEFAPTTGLLRTMRVERPQITLPHLDISPDIALSSKEAVSVILAAYKSSTKQQPHGKANEMEFAASNGLVFIPRANTEDGLDQEMELHSPDVRSVIGRLYDGSPRKLTTAKPEDTSSLRWECDPDVEQPLEDGEVEVKISHISLDSFDAQSPLQDEVTSKLGRGVVGFITRHNSKAQSLEIGQRVFTIAPNTFRTHIRQSDSLIRRLPTSLPSEIAASLPLMFAAAWHTLYNAGRFIKGNTVLVDVAAQSFNQAVIQLVRMFEGRILVSVSSEEEKETLMSRYNIPESDILGVPGSFTANGLVALTDGKGVDIIISSSSGVALRHLSSCLADGGCFVNIYRHAALTDLDPAFFKRNASFSSVDMDSLAPSKVFGLIDTILKFTELGSIAVLHPTKTYSVTVLEEAVSSVQSNSNDCSVVVAFDEDAIVPLIPSLPPKLALRATSTYVLSGGLGALGLTIADNLVAHGARRLVFLSRSGASSTRQKEALKGFKERGCAVETIKCDVTDATQVGAAARHCKDNGWEVQGIIQCAMVLQDSIFENMTYDKWRTTVDPKVKGTWNLHSLFPHELEFFVILSSMSGIIGNAGQANYCAGNTYEDAIAHYRRKLGLAGTSLDVGLVTDASHFEEGSTFNSTSDEYLKKYKHWTSAQVTDGELHIALNAVLRGTTDGKPPFPAQLLVGITDDVHRGDEPGWPQDRKFDHRVSQNSADADDDGKTANSTGQKMRSAQTVGEATAAVEEAIRTNVAEAITASPGDIDVEQPLYSFGIDSLKAIEVRNWIFVELKADVSVFDVLSPAPISRLALMIVGKTTLVSGEVRKGAVAALEVESG